jgi:hypothetical protein
MDELAERIAERLNRALDEANVYSPDAQRGLLDMTDDGRMIVLTVEDVARIAADEARRQV